MTIRHLRIFIEVAKTQNMSKAAEKLYISQPTVSQAIKELEEYYGILLFERLNKRLHITELGKKLYFNAKKVVNSFDDLDKKMAYINEIEEIKIGATVTVGDCILSDIISRLRQEHPKAEIYTFVGNTKAIEGKLLNNELDIGIVEGNIKSSDLIVKPELNDYLVLISSSKHPFAKRKEIKLEELSNENFAMREEGSGTRELFEEYMEKYKMPIKTVFVGNSPEGIKSEVIENNLLSVISIGLVMKEVENGDIHIIENKENAWNRYFSMVFHKDKVVSDIMKSLMKIIRNYQYVPDTMKYNNSILKR